MIPVIVGDNGHGGEDSGATWPLVKHWDTLDLQEKAITLMLGRMLRRSLLEEGLAAELTNEHDETMSLATRNALAKKHGADLVISIHVNSSPDPEAQGLMCFARHGDVLGGEVAKVIAANAPPCFRRKRNEFFWCRENDPDPEHAWLSRASNVVHCFAGTPTVLVEAFHLTNAKDREEWDAEGTPGGVVHAIQMGVDAYLMRVGVPVPIAAGGRPFVL